MKKENKCLSLESKVGLVMLSSIILVWGWFAVIKPRIDESSIEIGNLYLYRIKEENPFNKKEIHCYKITGKKDGYVQFVDGLSGDTMSMKISTFLHGVEKID